HGRSLLPKSMDLSQALPFESSKRAPSAIWLSKLLSPARQVTSSPAHCDGSSAKRRVTAGLLGYCKASPLSIRPAKQLVSPWQSSEAAPSPRLSAIPSCTTPEGTGAVLASFVIEITERLAAPAYGAHTPPLACAHSSLVRS